MNKVFLNYPEIEKVVIYGSRAMGNYRNGSDIDLTLFGKSLTYNQLNRIETQIDDLLLPYSVDLSLFDHIDNPGLVDHIHRVGKIFYDWPYKKQSIIKHSPQLLFQCKHLIPYLRCQLKLHIFRMRKHLLFQHIDSLDEFICR